MPGVSAAADAPAFQDLLPGNHCYGCGPDNAHGLRIKSRWSGERESVCRFQPQPWHCAGPSKYLNGGIVATLMDCHAICTAMAYAYRKTGREIGAGEPINYVTGALSIHFRRPAAIGEEITVVARLAEAGERKIVLDCTLSSGGVLCAEAHVVAVKVANDW